MATSTIRREIKRITQAYSLPAKSAGDSGFIEITFDNPPSINGNHVVSMAITSGSMSPLAGLQMTPMQYTSTGKMYVQYYAPKATTTTTITAVVWYYA